MTGDRDLERLIDERAKAVLAEEKAATVRAFAAADRQRRLSWARKRVATAREELGKVRASGKRHFGFTLAGILWFLVLWGVPHFGLYPVIGWSPAGIACPALCPGCSPVMRVFYRSTTTSTNNVRSGGDTTYDFVCQNAVIDVRTVNFADVEGPWRDRLAPYRVNGFVVSLIELALLLVPALPLYSWRRRMSRAARDRKLAAELADAEAALAGLEPGQPEAEAPYR